MFKMSDQISIPELTRKDFPLLNKEGEIKNNLIYLDHAATSQKPKQVINALVNYYSYQNANVHRGAHQLSAIATQKFENARQVTSKFIGSNSAKEIVFTRNATEAINLVAFSWGNTFIKENDEILISLMEHHSNIVPWQLLSKKIGCKIKFIGITKNGELDLEDAYKKLTDKTKLISILYTSNTLGCCNPIKKLTEMAHNVGAHILVDACQTLAHQKINVSELGIDFLAGSSHKLCGPTGCGFLWSKEDILEQMPPFLGGGEMIQDVGKYESSWADLPHKFEAGTPAIGEAIGMAEAMKYLENIGLEKIKNYENKLINYLFNKLITIKGIKILGPKPIVDKNRAPLVTFNIEGLHSNDIAEMLDASNICIRSGHHCCQLIHKYYQINSSARASLSFTSTVEEIDIFTKTLIDSIKFLKDNS